MENLFDYTVDKLKNHYATRTVEAKVKAPDYNRKHGEEICELMWKMCGEDQAEYDQAIQHLIDFSEEFLRLQMDLEKTGSYNCKSFEEARQAVYDNPDVMSKRYLYGLLLSQAFWVNHLKLLDWFNEYFVNKAEGKTVMEVPVGTGIYISEFMNKNNSFTPVAFDLSKSSCEFAREVVKINNKMEIPIHQQNVFDMDDVQYDRVICGELLEHLDDPEALLEKLKAAMKDDGKLFITTAIWAANIDHVYLFETTQEARVMIAKHFVIEDELVLNVFANKGPEDPKTPINYAAVCRKP